MTIINPWDTTPDEQTFGQAGATITPSDTEDLANVSKGIVVCATGNVVVIPVNNADEETITFTAVPAGFIVPYFIRRVLSTGTTATVASIDE